MEYEKEHIKMHINPWMKLKLPKCHKSRWHIFKTLNIYCNLTLYCNIFSDESVLNLPV